MPDTRVHMIRNARLRAGEVPREPPPGDPYLRPRPPRSLFGADAREKAVYERFGELLQRGTVVWGVISVATTELFKAGTSNGRGVVVFCPELHVHDDLDRLVEASHALHELRTQQLFNDQEPGFCTQVNNNGVWFAPRRPPTAVTTDDRLRVASVPVVRKHLPQARLVASCMPVLTCPDIDSVAILPDRYWPRDLIDHWNESA